MPWGDLSVANAASTGYEPRGGSGRLTVDGSIVAGPTVAGDIAFRGREQTVLTQATAGRTTATGWDRKGPTVAGAKHRLLGRASLSRCSANPGVRKSLRDFRANQKPQASDDDARTAGRRPMTVARESETLSSLSGSGAPARSKRASGSFEDHERREAPFERQRVAGSEGSKIPRTMRSGLRPASRSRARRGLSKPLCPSLSSLLS